jgi:hypothetical protein
VYECGESVGARIDDKESRWPHDEQGDEPMHTSMNRVAMNTPKPLDLICLPFCTLHVERNRRLCTQMCVRRGRHVRFSGSRNGTKHLPVEPTYVCCKDT